MGKYLVVLCDYGLDDAIATCHILENYNNFDKIDILAIGGNVSPEISFKNLKTLSAQFDIDERLTLVNTDGIYQSHENLYDIHGSDGMGGVLKPSETKAKCVLFDSWFSDYTGCDILLSLGPMTITEMLIKKAVPKQFIFMAGNVFARPNYNGYEFNQGINPQAFSFCCSYPHVAVTLDSGTNYFDVAYKTMDPCSLRGILSQKYKEMSNKRGEKNCYIWDDIATEYLLFPDKFRVKKLTDKYGNKINCLFYKGDVQK